MRKAVPTFSRRSSSLYFSFSFARVTLVDMSAELYSSILFLHFIHLLVIAVMLGPTLHLHFCKSSTHSSSKTVKCPKREHIQPFRLCNIWDKWYYSVLAKNHLRAGGKNLVTKKTLAANPVTGKAVNGKPVINSADIGICRHRWHEQNIIYN